MKSATKLRTAATTLSLLLLPALAQAHPGHAHDASFAAGALHPLTGVDHLLLLALAGVLAARLRGATLRALGATFVVVLAATASAHLGARDGAAAFAAGLLLTSVAVIAATAAAIHARRLTAVSRR